MKTISDTRNKLVGQLIRQGVRVNGSYLDAEPADDGPSRDGYGIGYNDELRHRPPDVYGRHYGDRPPAFRRAYTAGRAARRAQVAR